MTAPLTLSAIADVPLLQLEYNREGHDGLAYPLQGEGKEGEVSKPQSTRDSHEERKANLCASYYRCGQIKKAVK